MQLSGRAFESAWTLPKCREAYANAFIQTTGQHRLDARSNFPSPSSIQIFEKTLIRKVFCNRLNIRAAPF